MQGKVSEIQPASVPIRATDEEFFIIRDAVPIRGNAIPGDMRNQASAAMIETTFGTRASRN
jgi:hypothetical protein